MKKAKPLEVALMAVYSANRESPGFICGECHSAARSVKQTT